MKVYVTITLNEIAYKALQNFQNVYYPAKIVPLSFLWCREHRGSEICLKKLSFLKCSTNAPILVSGPPWVMYGTIIGTVAHCLSRFHTHSLLPSLSQAFSRRQTHSGCPSVAAHLAPSRHLHHYHSHCFLTSGS